MVLIVIGGASLALAVVDFFCRRRRKAPRKKRPVPRTQVRPEYKYAQPLTAKEEKVLLTIKTESLGGEISEKELIQSGKLYWDHSVLPVAIDGLLGKGAIVTRIRYGEQVYSVVPSFFVE